MKENQTGRSMIEMLGVLAVVGILSTGGISGYQRAVKKYKLNTLIEQLNELVMNVRTSYMKETSFANVSEQTLINLKIVPNSMLLDGYQSTSITHIYSSDVKFFPSYIETGNVQAFELYLLNITPNACMELASMDWGQDNDSGLISMYVSNYSEGFNAAQMEDIFSSEDADEDNGVYTVGQHENALPLSLALSQELCSCTASECMIGFKYR